MEIIEKNITKDFFLSFGNITMILKYIRTCSKSDVTNKMKNVINKLTELFNEFFPKMLEFAMFNKINSRYRRSNALIVLAGCLNLN